MVLTAARQNAQLRRPVLRGVSVCAAGARMVDSAFMRKPQAGRPARWGSYSFWLPIANSSDKPRGRAHIDSPPPRTLTHAQPSQKGAPCSQHQIEHRGQRLRRSWRHDPALR